MSADWRFENYLESTKKKSRSTFKSSIFLLILFHVYGYIIFLFGSTLLQPFVTLIWVTKISLTCVFLP